MTTIAANLQAVRSRIEAAALRAERRPDCVRLVAVSKTFPADSVRAAHAAGQRAFGENHEQEGAAKIAALHDLALEWHFIGPIQSNKTRSIAAHFDWVHSIDRLKIAQRLAEARPADRSPLGVLVQVNVSGEATKSGVAPAEVGALARAVAALPRLSLRGLMAIPLPTPDPELQRRQFRTLRELRDGLERDGLSLPELSMGMSADLESAVMEGATLVRVGSAIFGDRPAG